LLSPPQPTDTISDKLPAAPDPNWPPTGQAVSAHLDFLVAAVTSERRRNYREDFWDCEDLTVRIINQTRAWVKGPWHVG